MKFVGRIISVDYSGGAGMTQTEIGVGVSAPSVVANTATITSEQEGAWTTLRRVFTQQDGDFDRINRADPSDYWWDIAPYTPS